MKINTANIPEGGLNVSFSKDEAWSSQIFPAEQGLGFHLGTVEASVNLKKIHQALYLEGNIRATARMDCSRCLETAVLPIAASFKYILKPLQAENHEEKELSADDLDFAFYENELIDLDPLIAEQVMLQAPMKALCREECRGLCPHCGVSLNKESCRCHDERIDSRLAILKKLKV